LTSENGATSDLGDSAHETGSGRRDDAEAGRVLPARPHLPFGSEARGEGGPDSDLDFLVVVPDDTPEGLMRTGEVYSRLSGFGIPKDVIPWRLSDFEGRAAYVRTSLPATVVREGRLLYEST